MRLMRILGSIRKGLRGGTTLDSEEIKILRQEIKSFYPYGAIEITDKNGFSLKVNGQRLKKYFEGNIDKDDEEIVELGDEA
ncbi:hypothetical protein Tco_1453390, partial [Tanacetum coccineum]